MEYKVLAADDEVEILEIIELYLGEKGIEVVKADNGIAVLELLKKQKIDLVLLDIMMPGLDGIKVLKKIREDSKLPVIMLSAKGADYDKILGLSLGADDYLAKPFNPLELVARVEAQLRRAYNFQVTSVKEQVYKVGELELREAEALVTLKGHPLELTSTEYKLLHVLFSNAGKIFTKKQLFERVWENTFFGDDNTVMVHMSNLRNKIEADSKNPVYIKTIKGLGYKIEKEVKL